MRHRARNIPTAVRVMEILQELETVCQPSKDSKLSLERILPEEQVKDGCVVYLARLPVCVGHSDLVEI